MAQAMAQIKRIDDNCPPCGRPLMMEDDRVFCQAAGCGYTYSIKERYDTADAAERPEERPEESEVGQ